MVKTLHGSHKGAQVLGDVSIAVGWAALATQGIILTGTCQLDLDSGIGLVLVGA